MRALHNGARGPVFAKSFDLARADPPEERITASLITGQGGTPAPASANTARTGSPNESPPAYLRSGLQHIGDAVISKLET